MVSLIFLHLYIDTRFLLNIVGQQIQQQFENGLPHIPPPTFTTTNTTKITFKFQKPNFFSTKIQFQMMMLEPLNFHGRRR